MTSRTLTADEFILLMSRHDRRVRGFAATLLAFDSEAIDEVVQATCVVAWQKLATFSYHAAAPDDEFARWLCTIARFEVLQYLRHRRKHTAPTAFSDELIERLADEQDTHREYYEARRTVLAQCIERLSESQRETLRLRYGLGLSCKEVGERQQRQSAAVAAMLARIRGALERCISLGLRREGYTG